MGGLLALGSGVEEDILAPFKIIWRPAPLPLHPSPLPTSVCPAFSISKVR